MFARSRGKGRRSRETASAGGRSSAATVTPPLTLTYRNGPASVPLEAERLRTRLQRAYKVITSLKVIIKLHVRGGGTLRLASY